MSKTRTNPRFQRGSRNTSYEPFGFELGYEAAHVILASFFVGLLIGLLLSAVFYDLVNDGRS